MSDEARPVEQTDEYKTAFRAATSVLLERIQFARMMGMTAFNGARDFNSVLGYPDLVTVEMMRNAYKRGGLTARIVEAYPKATWRGGVTVYEDEDPKVETEFEKAWQTLEKRLGIWSIMRRVDILAGLSTFAVLLIGAPGELNTELPRGNGPDDIYYLTPYIGGGSVTANNSTITLATGVDASVASYDTDARSPRFGQPLTYQLRRTDFTSVDLQKPVHWTRIIHIAEGTLDNPVFGVPILENIWNLLIDLLKVTGGGAEAFWLRAHQGLNLNLDKEASLGPEAAAKLKEEVDEYIHGLSRVLKTKGMDVNTLGSDVANFANPADGIITQIAGTKAIPKRILTGSEMGQLASGQDADNWATQVQDRRTGYAGPEMVRRLIDRFIEYGYLPTPEEYEIGWPEIASLTEMEKAQGAQLWANTNQTAGTVIYTDDEIREHWHGLEPLTEAQRQKIDEQNAKKIADAQAAMAATQPPDAADDDDADEDTPPARQFPRAASSVDDELVDRLKAAIELRDAETVLNLIGLSEPEVTA